MAPPDVQTAREYLRVSRDKSGRERSNDEQHDDNQRAANDNGWTLAEPYSDTGSASRYARRKRKDFDTLVDDLRGNRFGADILVMWESSRGSRRLSEWAAFLELLEERGIRVHVTAHHRTYDLSNPRDRRTLQEDGVDSEYESAKNSQRVTRSVSGSFAAGRPHGRRPYGYKRVYDPQTGRSEQVPHPDEAPVVRRIFDAYLAGRGIGGIARDLTAEGIELTTGERWSHQTIRRMLTNPTYIARRVHKGAETAGTWPPLVDRDTFDRVARRFDARKGTAQVNTARLLTGVARCGVCGSKCGVIHDPKGRDVYWCRGGHCITRDLVKVDDHVTTMVLDRLARPEVADAMSGAPDPKVTAARTRVDELRAELDEAMQCWRGEVPGQKLSAQAYAAMENHLLPQIAAAEREARRALVPLDIDVPTTGVDEWWDGLPTELRREVVAALIVEVTIHRVGRGNNRKYSVPDSTTIEWRR